MEKILSSQVGILSVVKLLIIPRLNYGFNKILIMIPKESFMEFDKLILKCMWQSKGKEKTMLNKRTK